MVPEQKIRFWASWVVRKYLSGYCFNKGNSTNYADKEG